MRGLLEFNLIGTDEFGNKYYTDEGIDFASKILQTINEYKESLTFDYSLNVESVPAERANVVLCNKRIMRYSTQNTMILFTLISGFLLMENCTMQEKKIKLGALLDKECGGGTNKPY